MSCIPDIATTESMYESYLAGGSLAQVAGRFGVSRQSVYMRFRRAGKLMRPQPRFGADNSFYRGGYTQHVPAQKLIQKLVARGKLQPEPCETCGKTGTAADGRNIVHAHHDDYRKPEQVRWLCQTCHHEWHKHNRAIPCHV